MKDALRIEQATERDVPALLRLICGLAEYERLAHQVSATEERVRETLFGARPAAEALIAWTQGEAVGFAVYFQNYSTFLARPGIYLEDLFVLPAWRRRGCGRALLTAVARIAVERRAGRMEWAVLDWNEPAVRFYRSLGAVAMNEWTVYRLTGEALERLGQPRP